MLKPWYDQHILPPVVHRVCRSRLFHVHREALIPYAKGIVLEIGIGSGLNLPFYREEQIDYITAIDPFPDLPRIEQQKANKPLNVHILPQSAEEIPLTSKSIDTVVVTYALCTVPDVDACLAEIRRVLKKEGVLLFSEHGTAPDIIPDLTQKMIKPLWKFCGGGCHINRDIPALLKKHGFDITDLHTAYLGGYPSIGYNYRGKAVLV